MSKSNHYSLANPTSLLLDDDQIIERVFSHIDNKTTDLGDEVWKEPVKNYIIKGPYICFFGFCL